jgi:hypothetical protein
VVHLVNRSRSPKLTAEQGNARVRQQHAPILAALGLTHNDFVPVEVDVLDP